MEKKQKKRITAAMKKTMTKKEYLKMMRKGRSGAYEGRLGTKVFKSAKDYSRKRAERFFDE